MHNCYNPGTVKSNLLQHMPESVGKVVPWLIETFLQHPTRFGAYCELYAGLSQDLTIENDQSVYIIPWGRIRKEFCRPEISENMDEGEDKAAAKVWNWCERETNPYT